MDTNRQTRRQRAFSRAASVVLSGFTAAAMLVTAASPQYAYANLERPSTSVTAHADHQHHTPMEMRGVAAGPTDSPAADLRVAMNRLMAEHVYLAARATGAALGGQQAAFEAAAGALDGNSVDISKAIGAAYGPEAEAAFLPLWRAHIGMVVDYTTGLAKDDQAKQQKAVDDLIGYTGDFAAFLSGANENLPKDAVQSLVKDHVLTLKTVIDAQKARDQAKVYNSLREAMGHMSMVADPLAAATAKKFPGMFPGDPMTPAVSYRVAVDNLLAEHVYLATSAALGGIGGNEAQFKAAAAALDGNSVDISKGIGLAYGPDAEAAFLPLWRAHIGMVVDYVVGLATNDGAKSDKAVADLVGYTNDFAAFLSGANENLPKDAVQELVKGHILSLKDVIDAQKAGNPGAQFAAIRMAGGHMSMIGDPLAAATVAKFPGKFGVQAAAPAAAPTASGAATTADIRQFAYQPKQLSVPVGATVTWTNQDGAMHSITHDDAAFDSGLIGQGKTFSYTFNEAGQFGYHCTRHPSMTATVMVG
ncbi:MAG: cupredoxin family copper-binding protein [Chloroflexota bacterium]